MSGVKRKREKSEDSGAGTNPAEADRQAAAFAAAQAQLGARDRLSRLDDQVAGKVIAALSQNWRSHLDYRTTTALGQTSKRFHQLTAPTIQPMRARVEQLMRRSDQYLAAFDAKDFRKAKAILIEIGPDMHRMPPYAIDSWLQRFDGVALAELPWGPTVTKEIENHWWLQHDLLERIASHMPILSQGQKAILFQLITQGLKSVNSEGINWCRTSIQSLISRIEYLSRSQQEWLIDHLVLLEDDIQRDDPDSVHFVQALADVMHKLPQSLQVRLVDRTPLDGGGSQNLLRTDPVFNLSTAPSWLCDRVIKNKVQWKNQDAALCSLATLPSPEREMRMTAFWQEHGSRPDETDMPDEDAYFDNRFWSEWNVGRLEFAFGRAVGRCDSEMLSILANWCKSLQLNRAGTMRALRSHIEADNEIHSCLLWPLQCYEPRDVEFIRALADAMHVLGVNGRDAARLLSPDNCGSPAFQLLMSCSKAHTPEAVTVYGEALLSFDPPEDSIIRNLSARRRPLGQAHAPIEQPPPALQSVLERNNAPNFTAFAGVVGKALQRDLITLQGARTLMLADAAAPGGSQLHAALATATPPMQAAIRQVLPMLGLDAP